MTAFMVHHGALRLFALRRSLTVKTMASSQQQQQIPSVDAEATRRPQRKHQVSRRIRETQSPTVVMTRRYTEGSEDVLSLGQGVVYWTPPQEALEKAIATSREDPNLSSYGPDEGLPELRARLKEKIVTENGLEGYDVMVTAGAQQAFINCLLTLCDHGDGVVLFKPFYFNHAMNIQMTGSGAHMIEGPCHPETLLPDLNWLEWRCQQPNPPRMVVCVSPCNPTGQSLAREMTDEGCISGVVMSKADMERAAEICERGGAWLVMDNAYEYFTYDDKQHHCVAAPHVLHIFSFSKSYGMMGWRIGYVAYPAGDDEFSIGPQIIKAQDSIVICPSQIGQHLALACLSLERSRIDALVRSLEPNRKAVRDALAPLGTMGHGIYGGEGALYFWAKLPSGVKDDDAIIRWLVRRHGVCVIPGASCGSPGFIRVAFANLPKDLCQSACARLHRGLSELVAMDPSALPCS